MPRARRIPSRRSSRQFYDQLLQRVRALPGVESAAITTDLFLSNTPSSGTFTLEDRPPFPPSEQIEATTDAVSPGFFETMQVRLVSGRFLERRGPGWRRARRWRSTKRSRSGTGPNQDPVGKHMVFGTPGERNPWMTIVGVVGDMRRRGLHQGARLEAFFSTTMNVGRNMQLWWRPIPIRSRSLRPSAPTSAASTRRAP